MIRRLSVFVHALRFVLPASIYLLLLAQSLPSLAQDRPRLRAGAILSLSGGLEQWCRYYRQGIELAQEEQTSIDLEVLFEDDRSVNNTASLTAARKLVNVDGVDLLYSWTASTVPVLSRLADDAKVPLVIGAYDDKVAIGGPYVFGGFVNLELVPREIARLLHSKGARRFGLILSADEWSQNFDRPFRDEAAKLGGGIVIAETISPDETDARSLVLKLKNADADAVLAPLFGPPLFSFLKTARDLRFRGMVHVGDGMFEEDMKTLGTSAEEVYASQTWVEAPSLLAAYKRRFGTESNALQLGLVAAGYDWARHVRGAAESLWRKRIPIGRDTLKDELRMFRSEGYLGPHMFGGPPASSGEVQVVVRNGAYRRVQ